MKNIRFDLELFSENGEGCAAEQAASTSAVDTAEGSVQDTAGTSENSSSEKNAAGDADAVKTISAFFGIEGDDAGSLIEGLKKRQARAELMNLLRSRKAKKTYSELKSEADRLTSKIKGFDLVKELQNPRYALLVRSGFSLLEAWRAVHTEELISKASEEARVGAVAEALQRLRATQSRPLENGTDMRAPSNSKGSVENLTGRGIRDILKRVENGAKIKF